MADALAGHPSPLSWQLLLGGGLNDLAGKYKFVLAQPQQNFGALQPGGEATDAMRAVIAGLPFVKAGDARVRITGQVALADEEFATVVEGMVAGLVGSVLLITLWLFLAVKTWRLIVPILATLSLGLTLTLLFATIAVGTLNLVSVGFGILFVGIAVDFAIQFSVRYRERRFEYPDPAEAMRQNASRVGVQILVAACATSAGFLGFVPTAFSGVAELGLIAGVGMLIAFACTLGFLPAMITLCRPRGEAVVVGFRRLAPLDAAVARHRRPILIVFVVLAAVAIALSPRLRVRFRSAAHQEPEYRGDADAVRPDGRSGHQSVQHRYPVAERRRRRGAEGEAGEASHRLEGDRRSTASCRTISRRSWRIVADANSILSADAAGASGAGADDAGGDPAGGEERAGADRSGAGETAEGSSAGGDRGRSAADRGCAGRCADGHECGR